VRHLAANTNDVRFSVVEFIRRVIEPLTLNTQSERFNTRQVKLVSQEYPLNVIQNLNIILSGKYGTLVKGNIALQKVSLYSIIQKI